MRGVGHAPGTCGELVQGVTSAGVGFQVSLPIDQGAVVAVDVVPARRSVVEGLPEGNWKAARAAELAVDAAGIGPVVVRVLARRGLPPGKGLGSSSADVVAMARAVAAAVGTRLTPAQLAALAGRIEPSDPVAYARSVAAARRGPLLRRWDWSPAFSVLLVEPPSVATTPLEAPAGGSGAAYDGLLADLDAAVAGRDSAAVAAAATRSAALNQAVRPNALFGLLAEAAGPLDALGVVVAHTGTAAGLLFRRGDADRLGAAAAALAGAVPPSHLVRVVRTPAV